MDDLIAVGSTTGRVDLIRLRASAHTRGPASALSTGPSVPLTVRNSRACNALAFSTADPNYLAVGLDKVRGDPSLVIWDLTTAKSLLQIPGDTWPQAQPSPRGPITRPLEPQHYSRADNRILQQYAAGEVISALAFIPGTTHLLLAGVSNRHFRFFDLRAPISGSESPQNTPPGVSGPVPSSPYATSSTNSGSSGRRESWSTSTSGSGYGNGNVTNANSSPVSYYRSASSSFSNGSTTTTSSNVYNSSPLPSQSQSTPVRPTGTEIANVQVKVQGISADPLEPHRIACWNGDEGIVMIWDARKLKEPVLTFGERDALADGGYVLGAYDSFGGPGECAVCGGYGSHMHHHHHHHHLNAYYGEVKRNGSGPGPGLGAGLGVYVQAEWASSRRGTIATLEKDARFVRVWDVLSARPYVVDSAVSVATPMLVGATSNSGRGSAIRRSWAATLSWPRGDNGSTGQLPTGPTVYSPFGRNGEFYASSYNSPATLVLSDTRRSKFFALHF